MRPRLPNFGEFRLRRPRHRRHREIDDFDDLARRGKAESGIVGFMEQGPQLCCRRRREAFEGQRQFEFVVLSEIAHLERAMDLDIRARSLAPRVRRGIRLFELVHDPVGAFGIKARRYELRRALPVDPSDWS